MDIIFDIDGTVANIDHRLDYIRSKPKNWNAFDAGIPNDGVIQPVKDLFDILTSDNSHRILFASGRSERSRENTEIWLKEKGFSRYKKLYMRPESDFRPDFEIKAEILQQMRDEGYDPKICFDDRLSVVKQWPKLGVFCFCVNQGIVEF